MTMRPGQLARILRRQEGPAAETAREDDGLKVAVIDPEGRVLGEARCPGRAPLKANDTVTLPPDGIEVAIRRSGTLGGTAIRVPYGPFAGLHPIAQDAPALRLRARLDVVKCTGYVDFCPTLDA